MNEPMPTDSFAVRVAKAVAGTGPMCAGIDPSVQLLEQWGLAPDAGGLHTFGMRCIEAFAGVVPVVKPQVAFFERCGSAGIAALEAVIAAAREAGLIVIADAKRGDVDSTVEAYASAWLDPDSPLAADAVTAVAYLGMGALRPLFDLAARHGNGVIVVARSSNPEGRRLQQAKCDGGAGPPVEDLVLAEIAAAQPRRPRRPRGGGRGGRGHPGPVGLSAGRSGSGPSWRPGSAPRAAAPSRWLRSSRRARRGRCWPAPPGRSWPPVPTSRTWPRRRGAAATR